MASLPVENTEEAQRMKVEVGQKSFVKPNKKLGRRESNLVTFDLPYLAFYYNQKMLAYKGCDFHGSVSKLKEGLRVVLDDFYQLAGQLAKDDDGVFKVVYDDEMDGVEFSEAVADGINVAHLTAEDGSFALKELIPCNKIFNLEGLKRPLLAVQVTKLEDGLTMGCAFNHAILDGAATWHFMSSWANICRGSQVALMQPFLEREKARNKCVKLDLTLFENLIDGTHRNADGTQSLPVKLFKFSESAIDKITSSANENPRSDGGKPFSTFQSLGSHIWRHVTVARQVNPEDHTVFAVFADCRKRVDPPMPDTYFGNLIQAVFSVTSAGALTTSPPEYGASVIQKAVDSHDSKAIDARNAEWERQPKAFQYQDAGPNCVAVGSSPRFKVYEVDFGWGEPETVRSGSNNRFDGMVYLYPGKRGGRSIDVEISLEAAAMERLVIDKQFIIED